MVELGPGGCKHMGKKSGSKQNLTAGSGSRSAARGRRQRRQIDDGYPRWPRRGKAELAATRASGAFHLGEEEEGNEAGLG